MKATLQSDFSLVSQHKKLILNIVIDSFAAQLRGTKRRGRREDAQDARARGRQVLHDHMRQGRIPELKVRLISPLKRSSEKKNHE